MPSFTANKYLVLFIPVLFIGSCIIILPNLWSSTFNALLLQFPGIDKLIHTLEHVFIVLFLNFILYRYWNTITFKKRFIILITTSTAISFIDEGYQIFSPDRTVEFADILANTSGAFIGILIVSSQSIRLTHRVLGILFFLYITTFITYQSYDQYNSYFSGLHYERSGNFKMAKQQFLMSINSGHNILGAYNSLAWLNLEYLHEDYEMALEYSKYAANKDPSNPDYLDTYGWALFTIGDYSEALNFLTRAFNINPNIYCINYHLGMVYMKLGQLDKSRKHFLLQLQYNPKDTYAERTNEQMHKLNQIL